SATTWRWRVSWRRRGVMIPRTAEPVRRRHPGALRAAHRVRKSEVAARLGTPQAVSSQLERRRDFRVSTLRRYIAALGAELELSAVIGGRRVQLLASESAAGAPSASAAATRVPTRRPEPAVATLPPSLPACGTEP